MTRDTEAARILRRGVEEFNAWRLENGIGTLNLRSMDLSNLDLRGVNLSSANLYGANLRYSQLMDANLRSANLRRAKLRKVDFTGADLCNVNLMGAVFRRIVLRDAVLVGANLEASNFNHVDLGGIDFSSANLTRARLERKDLRETCFENAKLTNATLTGSNLRNANLRYADLRGGSYDDVDFRGADMRDVDLRNASLRRANLSIPTRTRGNLRWRKSLRIRRARAISEIDKHEYPVDDAVKIYGAKLQAANLQDADLRGVDFSGKDLRSADFHGAKLHKAYLRGSNLEGATLKGATLEDADLDSARLTQVTLRKSSLRGANLNGVLIDQYTIRSAYKFGSLFPSVSGGQVGVNGVWAEESDTAALVRIDPPGNSMLGEDPGAILESLRRARRLHGASLSLAVLGMCVEIYGTGSVNTDQIVELKMLDGIKFEVGDFFFLASVISMSLLSLVKSFLSDALEGARFLNVRNDAMKIARFPWAMSRYTGLSIHKKALSVFTRAILAFHPLGYLVFWEWDHFGLHEYWYHIAPLHEWLLMILLMSFSAWIFIISQQFQRPILFDPIAEKNRKTDTEKLTDAVERQTDVLESLVARLDPGTGDASEP